jgi:hypothetical protein
MRRKTYPLENLQKVRENDELSVQTAFSALLVELEKAEAELKNARKAAIEQQRTRWRFEANSAVPSEGCTAAELQRNALFISGLAEKERLLKSEVDEAQRTYDRVRAQVDEMRGALENAHAARRAVDVHRGKFEAMQRKEREGEAELETEDIYSVRK